MPYYSHIREAIGCKNRQNLLYLHYEEMAANLRVTVEKIASFLNCSIEETKVEQLLDHLTISNFRSNVAVNGKEMKDVGILNNTQSGFVRTGATGSSIMEFKSVPGLWERANKWVEECERLLEPNC